MKAFLVKVNGKRACLAGIGTDGVLVAHTDFVGGNGNHELSLAVGGLVTPKDQHVTWIQRQPLKAGDKVQIEVVETERVDRPRGRKPRRKPAQVRAETKR